MRHLLLIVTCVVVTCLNACPAPQTGDDDVVGDDDETDDDTSDDDVTTDDDSVADDDATPNPDDQDGDGFTPDEGDCNDQDPTVYPGAAETLCDQVDSDCDGWGEQIAVAIGLLEFESIPAAMTALQDGDVVSFCPGIHTDQLYIDQETDITLTSFSGVPEDTILDGLDAHTVIYLGHDISVTISHMTIRNGQGEPWIGGQCAGGGIMAFATSMTVEDCIFVDNHVDEDAGLGGAIAVEEYESGDPDIEVRVQGCQFQTNQAEHVGGAIYVDSVNPATVEISTSTFTDNSSSGDGGGALWLEGNPATVAISGCSFEGNTSGNNGGAARLTRWEDLTISQTAFRENTAAYEGGALYLDPYANVADHTTSATLTDCTFEANEAAYAGGAIAAMTYSNDTMDLCLDTVTFDGNHSGNNGGAIDAGFIGGFNISAYDTVFQNNTADGDGGAIEMDSDGPSSITLQGGSLSGNQASDSISAIDLNPAGADESYQIYLSGVTIEDNDDLGGYGAIFCNEKTDLTLDGCTIRRNTGAGVFMKYVADSVLHSIDTDWGTFPDDNDPWDVNIWNDQMYGDFGPNETFTCTGSEGCS